MCKIFGPPKIGLSRIGLTRTGLSRASSCSKGGVLVFCALSFFQDCALTAGLTPASSESACGKGGGFLHHIPPARFSPWTRLAPTTDRELFARRSRESSRNRPDLLFLSSVAMPTQRSSAFPQALRVCGPRRRCGPPWLGLRGNEPCLHACAQSPTSCPPQHTLNAMIRTPEETRTLHSNGHLLTLRTCATPQSSSVADGWKSAFTWEAITRREPTPSAHQAEPRCGRRPCLPSKLLTIR